MTISHILYGQYHIWDTFGLGLYYGNDGNRGQGTHSAKMGAYSSAENTPNNPIFIWPNCPIGSKVWDVVQTKGCIKISEVIKF